MPKRVRRRRREEGLSRRQLIGLGLIFIFILSTLAYAVIQAGI